ncbi:MAG: [FeFe] hydrogenase H-cluster radical SAM maturase HydE, partial [Clostridia bacterium]
MAVLDTFLETHRLTETEYIQLLENRQDEETAGRLREEAVKLRKQFYGNKVFTRGLIEFTNYCKNNCR